MFLVLNVVYAFYILNEAINAHLHLQKNSHGHTALGRWLTVSGFYNLVIVQVNTHQPGDDHTGVVIKKPAVYYTAGSEYCSVKH
jgi:hypothetical protein